MSLFRSSSTNSNRYQKPRATVPIANTPRFFPPLRPPSAPAVALQQASQGPVNTSSGGPSQYSDNFNRLDSPFTVRSENKSGNKRQRRDSGDDDGGQNCDGQKPKPEGRKGKGKDVTGLRLACHYYKRYNGLHCSSVCSGPKGWPNIHRLKGHLARVHKAGARCQRCGEVFMTVEDDRIHSNQNPPCSHRDPTDWSYKKYDQYQSDEVKKRYREVPGKNTVTHQEECWVSLWKILFPNWNEALHGCIPTAYYDKSPTRHFVECVISKRNRDTNLHQQLLLHLSGDRTALKQILEIIARHERASESSWQGDKPSQIHSAFAASDSSVHHAQDELQLLLDPPAVTPPPRPHLQIVPPSHPGYLSPNYCVSIADSSHTGSSIGTSQLLTGMSNRHLDVPGSRASASGETEGTFVGGGYDWEVRSAPCLGPDRSDIFATPSQGHPSSGGLAETGYTALPWPVPGQPQLPDLAMGGMSAMTSFAVDPAFASSDVDTNSRGTLPLHQDLSQSMQSHNNIVYVPQPWSNSLQRIEDVSQVIANYHMQFPNTSKTAI
ncbi:hypothetical protein MGG_02403 [Pyricularia oryzae 70-15]|uniref:C2H2-type domain-containing protein n=3 Tax=Pyricularia oryzae TaxID=318829 RepID=G4MRE6_PYRO7|nr:hypothetical protein, variant [Pyricularia oryzae 70-15]XP_003709186.1 uncharacterized protein MGG_02403 [Pyricularia oryzae 70-15]ELQ35814.1 hypothetical protein OOU_Y34scaffold00686g11 [Pyricularia oryzae Y34]KAI7916226.1 hypothetical protein M0657_008684 [Pyricularia oryzae]EHA56573.1 hypothetical protein, variant [Pyricularia oryzae 70-15]EHA56574.1 hypothetical protein MGG_02403 [Pyricularia oryzae 70-15]KAI7920697.1 hypothetical protein M9X92_005782 [Pyricularia oryzae]